MSTLHLFNKKKKKKICNVGIKAGHVRGEKAGQIRRIGERVGEVRGVHRKDVGEEGNLCAILFSPPPPLKKAKPLFFNHTPEIKSLFKQLIDKPV